MLRGRDFLFIIIGAVIFSFALSYLSSDEEKLVEIVSPLAEGLQTTRKILSGKRNGSLKEIVEASLANAQGKYGIVIKNLRTGESFSQNEKRIYEPASLYKLWVLGAAYERIKEGGLSEDKVLTREVTELNELFKIGTDSAELTEGTVTMRVDNAINQMITISHNYAALLLVSEIRNSRVSSFMREQGFNNSRLGQPPQTTAEDIALFFEKLYQGSMIDGENSKKMLDLLIQQKLNDRIPKYLPDDIKVAHKTGELGGIKHDAGIVFAKNPILIVVLSESNSPKGAAERIAKLSENVFNYFEGK